MDFNDKIKVYDEEGFYVYESIEYLYQQFKRRLADEAALNVWVEDKAVISGCTPDRNTPESDWDWLEKRLEEGVRDKPNLKKLLSGITPENKHELEEP